LSARQGACSAGMLAPVASSEKALTAGLSSEAKKYHRNMGVSDPKASTTAIFCNVRIGTATNRRGLTRRSLDALSSWLTGRIPAPAT
jgi:hypothetical protein